MQIPIDSIVVGPGHRRVIASAVRELAKSIEAIGLRTPISVLEMEDGRHLLVAGRHRLEACRQLKRSAIDVEIVEDKRTAELWEISENLHRSDLSVVQRSVMVGRWVKLVAKRFPDNLSEKSGGRPRGGVAGAARELNIPERMAQRLVHIANHLTVAAQKEAEKLGLGNNQRALERTAKAPPDAQVAELHNIADEREKRAAKKEQREREQQRIKDLLKGNAVPDSAHAAFLGWYWSLGLGMQRMVCAWLRSVDPAVLVAELEATDEQGAVH